LAGDCAALDITETGNHLELKTEAEERKSNRMALLHDCLETWQGSENVSAIQKESCAQNKQMTAVQYISDIKEIINTSCSNFQHDGAAAFKLSV